MEFVTEKVVSENAFLWRYDTNNSEFRKFENVTIKTKIYGDKFATCTFADVGDKYISVASKPYHCLCNAGYYLVWASDSIDDMAKYSIFRTIVEQCTAHIKDLKTAINLYYNKINRAKDILDVEHIDLNKHYQS